MENIIKAIFQWLDAVGGNKENTSPSLVSRPTTLLESKAILKILEPGKHGSLSSFLSPIFKKCDFDQEESTNVTLSLFLIYVSFSSNPEYGSLKAAMCSLDNNTQLEIMAFLSYFDGLAFEEITIEDVKKAAAGVSSPTCDSTLSPLPGTPARFTETNEVESPLQQFFQTPKQKGSKTRQWKCRICLGGERLKELQLQLEEEEAERLTTSGELKEAKATIADLEKKLQCELTRHKNLTANMAALECDLADKNSIISNLEEKCMESTRQVAILCDDLAFSQSSLADTNKQLSIMEKLYREVKKEYEELSVKTSGMESRLEKTMTDNLQLEELLEARTTELCDLRDSYQAMQTKHENVDNSGMFVSFQHTESLADQLLIDAKEEIERLKGQLEMLTSEKIQLQLKLNESTTEIDKLKSSLEKTCFEMETNLNESMIKLRRSGEQCERFNMKIGELENLTLSMSEEKSHLLVTLQAAEVKVTQLEGEVEILSENLVKTANELNLKKEALERVEAEAESLRFALNESTQNIELRILELKRISEKLEAAENMRDSQELLIQQMVTDLGEKEKEISDLQERGHQANELMENLTTDKAQLEVKINEALERQHSLNEALNTSQFEVTTQREVIAILEKHAEESKITYDTTLSNLQKEKTELNLVMDEKIREVKDLKTVLRETNSKYENEVAYFETEKANVMGKLSEKDLEVADVKMAFKKAAEGHNNTVLELKEEIEKLFEERDDVISKSKELQLNLLNAIERNNAIEAEMLKMNTAFEGKVTELEDLKSNLQKELDERQVAVDRHLEMLEIQRKEASALQSQFNKDLTTLEKENEELNELLQIKGTELLRSEEALQNSQSAISLMEKTLQEMGVQLQQATIENGKLQGKLEECHYNLTKKHHTITEMTDNLTEIRDKLQKTTENLNSQVDLVQEQGKAIEELVGCKSSLVYDKNKLQVELKVAEEIIEQFERKETELDAQLKVALNEKEVLETKWKNCERQLEETVETFNVKKMKMETELEQSCAEVEQKCLIIADCNEQIKKLNELGHDAKKENDLLSSQLDNTLKLVEHKTTELLEANEANSRLSAAIENLKVEKALLENVVTEREECISSLKSSIQDLRKIIDKSKVELEGQVAANNMRESTITALQEELNINIEGKKTFEMDLMGIRTSYMEITAKVAELEKEKIELLNLVNEIRGEIEICKKERDEANAMLMESLKMAEEKVSEIAEISKKINTLRDMLDKMNVELGNEKATVCEKNEIILNLEKDISSVRQKLVAAELQLEKRQQEGTAFQAQIEEQLDEMRSTLETKDKMIENLKVQLSATKCSLELEMNNLNQNNEKLNRDVENLQITVQVKDDKITNLEKKLEEMIQQKDKFEEKQSGLQAENIRFSVELEHLRALLLDAERKVAHHQSDLEDSLRQLEHQAVEFNREKMQIRTELEMHQRESATTLRRLEAKNLALDEVKNVAMGRVHELLKSHGQLRQELEDLVANKSVENSMLDKQVKEARSKCEDLTADLTHALANVDAFKATVRHLKTQQAKMSRLIKEKDDLIEELKNDSESAKEAVIDHAKAMKRLLTAFTLDDNTPNCDSVDETDYTETFGKILTRFKNVLEARKARQNDTSAMLHSLRNDVHVLQCEKLRLQDFINDAMPNLQFWATPSVQNLVIQLESMESINQAGEAIRTVLECSTEEVQDNDIKSLDDQMVQVPRNLSQAKNAFLQLARFAEELRSLAEAREKQQKKLEEDYKGLEHRALSLAEINSRLSTEILKAKNLSSMELLMREDELTSLKTTVSGLNEKIQNLSTANDLLTSKNGDLVQENEDLRNLRKHALTAALQKKQSETLLLNILKVKEELDKTLSVVRSQVPEMLTVICTLEKKRDSVSSNILAAIAQDITATEDIIDIMQMKGPAKDVDLSRLHSMLEVMKDIYDNVQLIQCKSQSVEDLSDSLEEVTVHEKTFPIINLHDDTFSMPPRVPDNSNKTSSVAPQVVDAKPCSAWVVSPPSKKKPIQAAPVKKEKSLNGSSWVIPVGPAPAKPARKTEPRKRSDSTSSTCSTQSLPTVLPDRSNLKLVPPRPPTDSNVHSMEAAVRQVKKEKETYAKECQSLKAKLADLEEKRAKEREQYENAKAVTRSKYEKQLEHMKSEMKHLYNQEMAKNKIEQAKMTEDLKKTNEELWKQNAAYKEHIDDLRSQLWSLGDKLLQEQNKRGDQDDLSKQLNKMAFHPSNITVSLSSGVNGDDTSGSRAHQPTFPPMPVEDEDEIFDNRCLEELKTGRPSSQSSQNPQTRLTELQIRNSLCLPHLKSSYPLETQFVSPRLFRENDLRTSALPFIGSESQSLTDSSDPSMTRSLLPVEKGKKKEQTSYKRPGPPTPSKNGRPSLQGEVRTPKRPLREQNVLDKSRGTPSRLKALFSSRGSSKRESLGGLDENSAPSTPRGKGLRIFQRKPFGGRDF